MLLKEAKDILKNAGYLVETRRMGMPRQVFKQTNDFEEYDKMKKIVSKWVNDNDVKDYDIIISNDDLMAYCGDCEEEFEYFQELVTVDDKQSMDLQHKFKHEQHTCVDKCKYSYPSDWYASKDMLTYNFYSSYLFIIKK